MTDDGLRVVQDGEAWLLSGAAAARFGLINEFLGYLADRSYSPRTRRSYAFDLMAFARWLDGEGVELAGVDVDVLLRFLTACRAAVLPGRAGGNVYSIRDGRNSGYAPATINRRLAAISALFAFREMRDPAARNPVPRGRAARTRSRGERGGLLGHVAKPKDRSRLRLREPRRLPRGLTREESAALLGSFRTWRDRAIAGLMLLSRAALGRGAGPAGGRCGHRPPLGAGHRQRRQGTAGPDRRRCRRRHPDLPAGRTPANRHHDAVRGGQGPAPGAAADRGRAAHGVPLPPRAGRGPGRASRTRCGTRSAPRWPRPGWTWR